MFEEAQRDLFKEAQQDLEDGPIQQAEMALTTQQVNLSDLFNQLSTSEEEEDDE